MAAGATPGHATDALREEMASSASGAPTRHAAPTPSLGEEGEGVDPEGEAALYALDLSDDEAVYPGLDEDAFAYGPIADPDEYEPLERLPETSVDPEGEVRGASPPDFCLSAHGLLVNICARKPCPPHPTGRRQRWTSCRWTSHTAIPLSRPQI